MDSVSSAVKEASLGPGSLEETPAPGQGAGVWEGQLEGWGRHLPGKGTRLGTGERMHLES